MRRTLNLDTLMIINFIWRQQPYNRRVVTVPREQSEGRDELDPQLSALIYAELHKLAASHMRHERLDHTLQPTALVNEAYLRLNGTPAANWESRAHFLGAASRAMRQILVDHARSRHRAKRQGELVRVDLADTPNVAGMAPEMLLSIDAALALLRQKDERAERVVELRFFAGLSMEEVAAVLGVSIKTAKRDWEFARAWLQQELKP